MIKYTRLFITFLLAIVISEARAQSTATTASPYSKYGIGNLDEQLLPQNIGMGGIATATNTIGGYNSINVLNPASYGKITYVVIDAGFNSNILTLSQNGLPGQRNVNSTLSHIAFAIPVTKSSAFSIGLLPYSQVGYNYKVSKANLGSGAAADTNAVNYIYSGDGGLNKAYLGYGFGIGKHLLIGANMSYIFGSLKQYQSTEIPYVPGVLDSRVEQDNHIGGVNFDYGVQYSIDFSNTQHLVLGYSASVGSRINVQNSYYVSHYFYDAQGNQNVAADSLIKSQSPNGKLQLPRINHFGVAFQREASFTNGAGFIIGADYSMGNWSDLTNIWGDNTKLQNSKMINIGGQITPNPNALSNYWATIDYKVGFIYEDTYLNINNTDIKRTAITFGLGIPLPHDRASSAFYKINLSAEIGKQGVPTGGLVQENYVNIHLGFTLNDKWFTRFAFQ
ncbi:MAG: hypothetical protein ACHQHN_14050 [Sphingobacteriales bacterium]